MNQRLVPNAHAVFEHVRIGRSVGPLINQMKKIYYRFGWNAVLPDQ